MQQTRDLAGQRFNRLTVMRAADRNDSHNRYWECKCDCGQDRIVREWSLLVGKTQSCGCYAKQVAKTKTPAPQSENVANYLASRRTPPPLKKTTELSSRLKGIWAGMKRRCLNPQSKDFHHYGGRGITICPSWIASFDAFFRDMASSYLPGLTIERIDNDGPYCPFNCRWANRREQANNYKRNVLVEFRGETHTPAEWARILNINPQTFYNRRHKHAGIDDLFKQYRILETKREAQPALYP